MYEVMTEVKGTDEEGVLRKGSKNVTTKNRQRRPFGVWWLLFLLVSLYQTPLCVLMIPQCAIRCRVKQTMAEDRRGGPANISAELYKSRSRRERD